MDDHDLDRLRDEAEDAAKRGDLDAYERAMAGLRRAAADYEERIVAASLEPGMAALEGFLAVKTVEWEWLSPEQIEEQREAFLRRGGEAG